MKTVEWTDFETFSWTEYDDSHLYSVAPKNVMVITPGGKKIKINKGDTLLVDKRGLRVTRLEKPKKKLFSKKVKDATQKKAKKEKETQEKNVLEI